MLLIIENPAAVDPRILKRPMYMSWSHMEVSRR